MISMKKKGMCVLALALLCMAFALASAPGTAYTVNGRPLEAFDYYDLLDLREAAEAYVPSALRRMADLFRRIAEEKGISE